MILYDYHYEQHNMPPKQPQRRRHVLVLLLLLIFTLAATPSSSAYKKTCPARGHPLCHPGNMCTQCHPTCKLCQNLDRPLCGVADCMTCKRGYYLRPQYMDGTGPCVEADQAYLPTCPRGVPGCAPGNRALRCHPSCATCWSDATVVASANQCVTCPSKSFLLLSADDEKEKKKKKSGSGSGFFGLGGSLSGEDGTSASSVRAGTCISRRHGYKSTCPADGHEACTPENQCKSCAPGCALCDAPDKLQCGPSDCVKCRPGYRLVGPAAAARGGDVSVSSKTVKGTCKLRSRSSSGSSSSSSSGTSGGGGGGAAAGSRGRGAEGGGRGEDNDMKMVTEPVLAWVDTILFSVSHGFILSASRVCHALFWSIL